MASWTDQLRRYGRELKARGFVRLSFEASPGLIDTIVAHRRHGESVCQVLERLVNGTVEERPRRGGAASPAARGALERALTAEAERQRGVRDRMLRKINRDYGHIFRAVEERRRQKGMPTPTTESTDA